MIEVPAEFAELRVRRVGAAALPWLARVPHVVADLCSRWQVAPTGEPARYGDENLVIPVRQGGDRMMLKLCSDGVSGSAEIVALRTWAGHGAVRLVADAPDDGALLIERLDASRTLHSLPIREAAAVAGGVLRRLTVPAPAGLPTLRLVSAAFVDTASDRQRALGAPVPAAALAAAVDLARAFGPTAATTLIHADLHYGNVLAGDREPWLAIDPRAVVGDPEYCVPELIWTRVDDVAGPTGVRRLLAMLVDAAGLGADRARGWVLVRAVDYWLWGLENGLTEDPVRCSRIVDALT